MSKFKIGDRVRVKPDWYCGYAKGSRYDIPKDEEGEITAHRGDQSITIRYSDGETPWVNGDGFNLVAPAPKPLTIIEGRYYKTRDGRKVGPMAVWCRWLRANPGGGPLYDSADSCLGGEYWQENGVCGDRDGIMNSEYDLISEWSEGPVVTETVKRIVEGEWDGVVVSNVTGSDVTLRLVNGRKAVGMTAPEIRAAMAVMDTISEALEEQK